MTPARPSTATPRVRIVGRGRAGGSFAGALRAAGWQVELVAHDAPADSAHGVDLLMLCVPDSAISDTARAVDVDPSTVVAHCSGASTLDVLTPHRRVASVHPLVSLPDPVLGARRLPGSWFAIAGDPIAARVVEALDGHPVQVDDEARIRYHAAAVIASNHLVALLGQVERVAAEVDVPLSAFLDLARGTLDNVAAMGPAAALTGPVARGDHATVQAHIEALEPSERDAYRAMSEAAARLVRSEEPAEGPASGTPRRAP